MTIAELTEDRVVEGIYAVRLKRKLRTKSGAELESWAVGKEADYFRFVFGRTLSAEAS